MTMFLVSAVTRGERFYLSPTLGGRHALNFEPFPLGKHSAQKIAREAREWSDEYSGVRVDVVPGSVACACAHNSDGTVTSFLCPLHADADPCETKSSVTGKRREGSIMRGACTACGWAAAS